MLRSINCYSNPTVASLAGYDAYLKAPQAGADRKRARGGDDAKDSDRLFSRSSATYQKVRSPIIGLLIRTDC